MSELSRTQTPPGGWQFTQPQTGWAAPTPIASTFDQTVVLIQKHRMANSAIVAKHNLNTEFNAIAKELEAYTRTRLGMPDTFSEPARPGAAPVQARCCGQ